MGLVETVQEIRELLVVLTRRYAFGEVAYLTGSGATGLALSQRELAGIQQLCAYGQRLMDLDAEDFGERDAAAGAGTDTTFADFYADELVPEHLVERSRLCQVQQTAHAQPRALLASLHPAYRLLLEVIAARWHRHEMSALLAAVHISSEYAPLLAWQPWLGHAADPVDLARDPAFTGPRSRWGDYESRSCAHTRAEKAAAGRALRVADEPPSGWRAYLDRQHSIIAHALGTCATECPKPCTVVTSRTEPDLERIRESSRIARAYGECALVRLRHAAPVGHGFGVPSPAEVAEAWQRSRDGLAERGGLGVAAATEDGYPLAGLPSLLSAIASVTLKPDTLLEDTATEIAVRLDPDGVIS